MPIVKSKKKRAPSYILITDGFDELEVVYILHKFRQAGLKIKSVSLFDRLVFSRQGVGLRADMALADAPLDVGNTMFLILPAGGRNGEALRHDARVKSLLKSFQNNGRIAVTDSHSTLADDVHRLLRQPLYEPGQGQDLGTFVDDLTGRLAIA